MLVLSRNVGQKLAVGNSIVIEVLKTKGSRVSLGIEAPREVCIYRDEIRDRFEGAEPNSKTTLARNRSSEVDPKNWTA